MKPLGKSVMFIMSSAVKRGRPERRTRDAGE
jgi:hypothetical protein